MSVIKFSLSVLAVWLLIIFPELCFGIINPHLQLCWLPEKLAVILLWALILTLTPRGKFKTLFIAFFALCSLVQFCYMKYFGTYLTPYAINFIFLEFADIALEAKYIWPDYIPLSGMVILPYTALIYLCLSTAMTRLIKNGYQA